MDNISDDKVVAMHAVFTIDGKNEKHHRAFSQVMNVTRILGAPTLNDAIEYFKTQVQSIEEVEDFDCFIIEREVYNASFWE
jgi:hypothetical protein